MPLKLWKLSRAIIWIPVLLSFSPLCLIYFVQTTPSLDEATGPSIISDSYDHYRREYNPSVLVDPLNFISPEFRIPAKLEPRVHFWFDIYTRYSSMDHVIHHRDFPWIVFKVVDSRKYMGEKTPRWLARQRGELQANRVRSQILLALKQLLHHPNKPKGKLEKELAEKLKDVPGGRSEVYADAAGALRIQLGQMDFFVDGLERSSRYLPLIEEVLADMHLPMELACIPLVESSFNDMARSKVGASGIWQIMPQTGRRYLLMNFSIDERNSPIKATKAAARLLRSYRESLGDWSLAVAAYNHGIGTMYTAIRKTKSRDIAEIVDQHRSSNYRFASQNYFASFLAALYAERYKGYIFQGLMMEPMLEREVVRLPREVTFKEVMQHSGVSAKRLLRLNLDLKPGWLGVMSLPRGFELSLPSGEASGRLLERIDPSRVGLND